MLLDRFDLAPKFRERFAANLAQDLHIAPLAMEIGASGGCCVSDRVLKPVRAKAAFKNAPLDGELVQTVLDDRGIKCEPVGNLAFREWAVRTGIAANEFQDGLSNRPDQRSRQTGRKRYTQCIAIPRC